jgi:hypothetical protein
MSKRTDQQKVAQTAIEVKFGEETFRVKPLTIEYSLPWVDKVVKVLVGVIPLADMSSSDARWGEAIGQYMVQRPRELIDLFFEYARDLDRPEIEKKATSAQIVAAFEGVMSMESPLLGMAMRAFVAATPKSDLERLLSSSSPSGT